MPSSFSSAEFFFKFRGCPSVGPSGFGGCSSFSHAVLEMDGGRSFSLFYLKRARSRSFTTQSDLGRPPPLSPPNLVLGLLRTSKFGGSWSGTKKLNSRRTRFQRGCHRRTTSSCGLESCLRGVSAMVGGTTTQRRRGRKEKKGFEAACLPFSLLGPALFADPLTLSSVCADLS